MNKTQTTMNKTSYFRKPIHMASTRKREIERALRLIRVVKSVRELKRETVRELLFSFCQDHTSSLSLRFHNLKSQFFFLMEYFGICQRIFQEYSMAYSVFLFTKETTHRMGSALQRKGEYGICHRIFYGIFQNIPLKKK